jgi:hypothetical protein
MRFLNRAVLAAAVLSLALPMAAADAAPRSVLDLELNDAPGSSVARDSSGLGHNGRIGSLVSMTGQWAHFGYHPDTVDLGNAPLIVIPDAADGSLDPGSGAFSVAIRYRSTYGENLFQKGQATTSGGQFKIEFHAGKITCGLKTSGGNAVVNTGDVPVENGVWHTIRCDRTADSLAIYVDGVRKGRSTKHTGNLDNKFPWTLGGKSVCNGQPVTCDYFSGDIDYVRVTKG